VEQFDIETPENYLLTINDDGSLNIKADCNNASGNYTIDGSSLSIEVGPMTRAACPPGSLSDQFIKYLGFSAIYFFQGGNLFVDMMADGGTMEFAHADVPDDGPGSLVGTDWQWSAFTNPVEQFTVEDPQNYRLAFNDDGTLNIKADCNNASGSYTVDGSSLNIEIGPMTLAACPPGSLSDQFIKYLGFSAIYFFKDGNLFIDLFADGGTLELTPSG
jgi:heat shock protein HslJ